MHFFEMPATEKIRLEQGSGACGWCGFTPILHLFLFAECRFHVAGGRFSPDCGVVPGADDMAAKEPRGEHGPATGRRRRRRRRRTPRGRLERRGVPLVHVARSRPRPGRPRAPSRIWDVTRCSREVLSANLISSCSLPVLIIQPSEPTQLSISKKRHVLKFQLSVF